MLLAQAESVRESARLAFLDAERAAEAEISRLEKALSSSLSQARDSEAGFRKKRTKALAELQVQAKMQHHAPPPQPPHVAQCLVENVITPVNASKDSLTWQFHLLHIFFLTLTANSDPSARKSMLDLTRPREKPK